MNTSEVVKYWKEGAKENWRITKVLHKKKEYPYALFFGHLTLEKALKALITKTTKHHAKYTHDLEILANDAKLDLNKEEKRFLKEVTDFNLEARYPENKLKFYKKYKRNTKLAKYYFEKINKFYLWLKKQY